MPQGRHHESGVLTHVGLGRGLPDLLLRVHSEVDVVLEPYLGAGIPQLQFDLEGVLQFESGVHCQNVGGVGVVLRVQTEAREVQASLHQQPAAVVLGSQERYGHVGIDQSPPVGLLSELRGAHDRQGVLGDQQGGGGHEQQSQREVVEEGSVGDGQSLSLLLALQEVLVVLELVERPR